jgi:hypothetical protein
MEMVPSKKMLLSFAQGCSATIPIVGTNQLIFQTGSHTLDSLSLVGIAECKLSLVSSLWLEGHNSLHKKLMVVGN